MKLFLAAVFLGLLGDVNASAADISPPFAPIRAELGKDAGRYLLQADVGFSFTPPVLKALQNGVPLTFLVNLHVRRPNHWRPDSTLTCETFRLQLSYHALAKLYQVRMADEQAPQNFVSLPAALEALGHIRQPLALDPRRVFLGQGYPARLRLSLDLEALPVPLRSVAFFSTRWRQHSPWHEWIHRE